MDQLDMFAPPEPTPIPESPIWPHQQEALDRNAACWKRSRRILDVMATGTGKTRVAIEEIRRTKGRCLFLADRDVIVGQAQRVILDALGEPVGREQAGWYASDQRVVVASVPTMRQPDRLMRFARDAFELVIYDEAHHSVAGGAKSVLAHFDGARLLGLTATPDRTDELPLGSQFDETAFVYGIWRAIKDGILVEPQVRQVKVDAIDFSTIKVASRDFTDAEVAAVVETEGALHGIASATVAIGNLRKTLGFAPSVRAARMLAELCNRYAVEQEHPHGNNYAKSIDCSMPAKEVRDILRQHRDGAFTALWNYSITVEGYDDPMIACLSMARPTKSRLVCEQMVGRLLRRAPGKTALLLEFTGNLGRHKLSSVVDVLGSDKDDEVVAKARKRMESGQEISPVRALEQAEDERQAYLAKLERERIEQIARRAAITARVDYSILKMDPFSVLGIERQDDSWAKRFAGKVPTEPQVKLLRAVGIEVAPTMTFAQAQRLVGVVQMRRSRGLASFRQIRCLKVFGINAFNMYGGTAGKIIGYMAEESKRLRRKWQAPSPEKMKELIGQGREPGEEG